MVVYTLAAIDKAIAATIDGNLALCKTFEPYFTYSLKPL